MGQVEQHDALKLASEAVRPRFFLRLATQLDQMRVSKKNIDLSKGVASSLETISEITHKIAGIADFVGHRELGISAAILDENIFRFIQSGLQEDTSAKLKFEICAFIDQCDSILVHQNDG